MRRVLLVAFAACLVSLCAALAAQPFPSPNVSGTAPTQPKTIHLDVLVKDQSGTSIRGIPQQFFAVLDNGHPQKLVSFKQVDPKDDPGAVHVLIVMDMINPGYNSVTWGREQLSEYLRQEGGTLHHRTSLAAMTEDGLQMMSGSTTDGNVLRAQLAHMSTHLRLVSQTAGWQGLEQLFNESMAQFAQILAIEQARPGRKLVLFISSGWPALGWWGSEEDLHAVQQDFNMIVAFTNTIRDARTAIYRLDPFELGGDHSGDHSTFYYQDFLKPVTNPKKATYPFLQLGVFAIHSGGRVMVTGKDITGELNNAKRDGGAYYELTYAAPPAGGPNEYHAIKVQVNQPGTFVQTISGYYADPQSVGSKPKDKKKR
jgi:VWFA-related protein